MRSRIVIVAIAVLAAIPAGAADHRDGPAVRMDPATDINDVFAWMSPDATRVFLAMTVFPFAGAGARFTDQAHYVFHTTSQATYGATARVETDVICGFDAAQTVECWVGGDLYVRGDASNPAGLASDDGRVHVFAGRRNDPFFFNLSGFNATANIVIGAAGGLEFDAAGCPQLDAATSEVLVRQLATEPDGSPARDDFLGADTLALVVSVDQSLLTPEGRILGVWGATHAKN